ncbi:O-methyltransferase [Peziza echinospora]|nr:O-methyltransferase [Peziza echinospora]
MYAATELYPNQEVTLAVHEYCIEQSTPLAPHISQHREDTIKWAEETGSNPNMMINTLQSQFLTFYARAVGAKKVLEIGCFTGYSALSFAEALKNVDGAEITTLDLDTPSSALAQSTFTTHATPSSHPPIHLRLGPASTTLPLLSGKTFDLIFLDANKDGYLSYLHTILDLKLLAPNGTLVADNTLYRGLVAERSERNPAAVVGDEEKRRRDVGTAEVLDAFNREVRRDGRLENVLVPVFDGLNFVRWKGGVVV